MGYLFLCIALLAGVTKGYCGKRTSGYIHTFHDALLANSIRMIMCAVIGFLLIIPTETGNELVINRRLLLISALSGASTAIFVVTWLILVKKSTYMLLDIFLMLGILVPLAAGYLFFDEPVKVTQWLGIAVLFLAVFLMYSHNNAVKEKLSFSSAVLLVVCGAANGIADFSQKLFIKSMPDGSAVVFNFFTYVFAAVILTGLFAVTHKKENAASEADIKKIFGFVFFMAVCLFANSYFKTLAAGQLSAVLLYPLHQGGSLILSGIMSAALFREKLTGKGLIGMVAAFVGLLIINLL